MALERVKVYSWPMADAQFQCVICRGRTSLRFDRCPKCRNWNTCERVTEAVNATAAPTLDQFQAHDPPRLHVSASWDRALGGGLALGTSLAMWGRPGSNKTTEALRMCAAGSGLFLESEFPEIGMLRTFVDRAKINAASIVPFYVTKPRDACAIIRRERRRVTVIDSLNALCGASSTRAHLRESLEDLRAASYDAGTTLIVILHTTRAGKAAAPTWIEFMVDTTIRLSRTAISVTKSRFAPTGTTKRAPQLALAG